MNNYVDDSVQYYPYIEGSHLEDYGLCTCESEKEALQYLIKNLIGALMVREEFFAKNEAEPMSRYVYLRNGLVARPAHFEKIRKVYRGWVAVGMFRKRLLQQHRSIDFKSQALTLGDSIKVDAIKSPFIQMEMRLLFLSLILPARKRCFNNKNSAERDVLQNWEIYQQRFSDFGKISETLKSGIAVSDEDRELYEDEVNSFIRRLERSINGKRDPMFERELTPAQLFSQRFFSR